MPRPMPFEIPADNTDRAAACAGVRPREEAASTVYTIGVASVDESVRKVESRGGKTLVPRMAIPGMGWLAYCVDTEGDTFGIIEADEKAR